MDLVPKALNFNGEKLYFDLNEDDLLNDEEKITGLIPRPQYYEIH